MACIALRPRLRELRHLVVANLTWRGRASRKTLFISIGLLYLLGLLAWPLAILQMMALWTGPGAMVLDGLVICLGLAMMAHLVGAFVRRLHDRGKAGWWLLVFLGPHLAMVMLLTRTPPESFLFYPAFYGGMIVDLPLLLWWTAETFFRRGTAGPNRFGRDPLADTRAK